MQKTNKRSNLTRNQQLSKGLGERKTKNKKEHPEAELQHNAMVWFYKNYPDYCFVSTHNESAYKSKEKYKRTGLYIGVADVILLIPNQVLFVEFKAPRPHTSKISREQKAFEKTAKWLFGEDCHLYCYSLEQFQDFVNQHISNFL